MNEFRITMPNTPGNLARVVKGLADHGVSVLGLSCHGLGDEGFAAIVVDKEDEAREAFGAVGASYDEVPCCVVTLEDRVGALAEACSKLGSGDANIETGYIALIESEVRWIFTSDSPRAAGILGAD